MGNFFLFITPINTSILNRQLLEKYWLFKKYLKDTFCLDYFILSIFVAIFNIYFLTRDEGAYNLRPSYVETIQFLNKMA